MPKTLTATPLWTPHPGRQTLALKYRAYELLYGGSRGGGKTDAGIVYLLLDDYHRNKLYRALVIRRNSNDLNDWIDRAERMYANEGAKKIGNPPQFIFPSGARIRTGHLKDVDAYTKYQGHEYQRMLVEELTQIAREDDYQKLLGSCRSTVHGLIPSLFATTNPTGKGHAWVKKRFVKGDGVPKPMTIWIPPETKRPRIFIPASIFDNPTLLKNDPGYLSFLEGLPTVLKEAWLKGNWDIGAGQFFDEWNHEIHVCEPFLIPKEWLRFICMDYGYAAPAAVYWCAVDPKSGKVYTYRELYVTLHTYEVLTESIFRLTPSDELSLINWMVVDSSVKDDGKETGRAGLDIIQEVLFKKKWDIGVRLASKGPGSRINGWQLMRGYLRVQHDQNGYPVTRWQVFKNCVKLIEMMPAQLYDEKNKNLEDLDTDGEDHAPDAIRYGFRALNEPWDKPAPLPKREPSNPVLTDDELFFRIEKNKKYRR